MMKAPRFTLLLAGCVFAGFAAASPPAGDLPACRLRSEAFVGADGIPLSALVESESSLPNLRLGDAPALGQTRLLTRAQVSELVHAAGVEMPLTNWQGASAVRISRRTRKLPEEELLQMLTAAFQKEVVKDRGEVELRLTRPWQPVAVPDEPLKLELVELPPQGIASALITRFELQTSRGESVGSWQTTLQAHVWREVWVARSPLSRGAPLRATDITRERRDILTLREATAEFDPGKSNLELSEPLPAGLPLLARCVRPRPLIRRGQTVAAVLEDGMLAISLKVEALEDGVLGQTIRIRNPISRRDLHGKVVDEKQIQVCL